MSKQSPNRNFYAVPISYTTTSRRTEPKYSPPEPEAQHSLEELGDILNAALRRIRGLEAPAVAACIDDDPLDRLTRLSEDLNVYDGDATSADLGQRDPTFTGYANINVSIEGDKWAANDLLDILEASILETIREYKYLNAHSCSLKTTVGTNTHSSQ